MSKSTDILLVGVGGQGTILAGKILSRVALLSGLDVKFSEIHGMAQRGGSVVTHVRLGERVFSPIIEPGDTDWIVAFENLEGLRWVHYLRSGGTIILSTQMIEPVPVLMGVATYPDGIVEGMQSHGIAVQVIDALEMATRVGNTKASNVVLLGCLARKLDLDRSMWLQALEEIVPTKFLAVNLAAFGEGWNNGWEGVN